VQSDTTAQEAFRGMLRDLIAPALREMGLKGSGQHYRLDLPEYWVQIGFQKSRSSTADQIKFTVNLSVINKEEWADVRARRSWLPERPSPNEHPPIARSPRSWADRIGAVIPPHQDVWWQLHVSEPVDRVADEVISAIREYALPEMKNRATPL
jgi:hypothetical protein